MTFFDDLKRRMDSFDGKAFRAEIDRRTREHKRKYPQGAGLIRCEEHQYVGCAECPAERKIGTVTIPERLDHDIAEAFTSAWRTR